MSLYGGSGSRLSLDDHNERDRTPKAIEIAEADPETLKTLLAALAKFLRGNRADRQLQVVEYLIEQERNGLGDRLKAYSLAVDVFGQSEDFDPANQSLVRVEMHRLRSALEQFASSTAGQFQYELQIPLGKYRPILINSRRPPAIAQTRSSAPRFDDEIEARPPPRRSLRLTARYISFGILFLIAAIVSFAALWQQPSSCLARRPTVTVVESSNAGAVDDRVRSFLEYYSLVIKQGEEVESCGGSPHYTIRLWKSDGENNIVNVQVKNAVNKERVFDKSYVLEGKYGIDPVLLMSSRIAYDIAHDKGAIPTDALSRPWGDSEAESNFRCLMKGHEYFYAESMKLYTESLACLKEISDSGTTDPDMLSIYAALLSQSYLGFVKIKNPAIRSDIDKILARAAHSEPTNKELIIVRLRLARFGGRSNLLEIAEYIDLIGKLYPYEPHSLNQAAIANSANLGRFEQGIAMEEQALAIAGPRPLMFWGKLWGEAGLNRWQEIGPYLPYFEDSDFYLDQLITMIVRQHLDQPELARLAEKKLADAGYSDRRKLIEKVRTLNYNRDIIDNLINEIDRSPYLAQSR